jgi:hypothetical protein
LQQVTSWKKMHKHTIFFKVRPRQTDRYAHVNSSRWIQVFPGDELDFCVISKNRIQKNVVEEGRWHSQLARKMSNTKPATLWQRTWQQMWFLDSLGLVAMHRICINARNQSTKKASKSRNIKHYILQAGSDPKQARRVQLRRIYPFCYDMYELPMKMSIKFTIP